MTNPTTPMQIKLTNLRIINEYALLMAQTGEHTDEDNLTQCLEVNQQIIHELIDLNTGMNCVVNTASLKVQSEQVD